ncbi:MAG: hypothetical protein HY919_02380 [Elusimicrobia bacterium]|nr:hypothetical protein [Elusimicrobiota bacterium]
MPKKKIKHSEVRAYNFILNDLEKIGWIAKNPSSHDEGEVWTQTECLSESGIKKYLQLEHPENIVKLNESDLYLIEAKRTIVELEKATDEAIYYSNKINKGKNLKVKIISGVVGNPEDGYYIKSKFFKSGKWNDITINNNSLTSLVSKKLATQLLLENTFEIKDILIVTFPCLVDSLFS